MQTPLPETAECLDDFETKSRNRPNMRNIAMCDYQESVTTGQTHRQKTPDKVIPLCHYALQVTQKVIPMCRYALQATQIFFFKSDRP